MTKAFLSAATIALVALTGCQKKTVITADNGAKVEIDANDPANSGTITAKSGDSSVVINPTGNGRWPDSLPGYVASYPGSTVTMSMLGKSESGGGGMLTFETSDPGSKVFDFYKQRAESAGLASTASFTNGDGGLASWADGSSKRSLQLQIGKNDGKTAVVLTYGAR